jgi:hypothetical protein
VINKKNVKETRPRPRIKRKIYLILSVIIIIKKDIMQLYVPNPIRGRKVRINNLRR